MAISKINSMKEMYLLFSKDCNHDS